MPSPNSEAQLSVPPALAFRLEILKKELDSIDNSIRKIDDIGNSIKNWAILAWTGSIAAVLGKPELYGYTLFSALPPLMFMMVDAHWRKIQRRLTYRQGQISDFLNSKKLDAAYETGEFDFPLLDPIARKAHARDDFKRFISIPRILRFPTISLIYVGLVFLSIAMATLVYLSPPPLPASSMPPSPPAPAMHSAKPTP